MRGTISLLLLTATAWAANVDLRVEGERIWLSAHGVAPAQVFSQLADRTGVRFLVDPDLEPGLLDVEIDGLEIERAVQNIVHALPKAAGHTMAYVRTKDGGARLAEVKVFGAGQSPSGAEAKVYGAAESPLPFTFPTPDLEERLDKMVEAGVPRETAEKVIDLTREVQRLQATPAPGSYSVDDLSPESREQLDALVERGVAEDRAIQMLLLQEKYQHTLKELSDVAQTIRTPTPPPAEEEE